MQRATRRIKPSAQARLSELSWPDLSSLAAFCEGMISNVQLFSYHEFAAHGEYAKRLAQQAVAGQLRADRNDASSYIIRALNAMARWPFYDSAKYFDFVMGLGGTLVDTLGGLSESAALTPAFARALLRSGFLASLSRQVAERADAVRDRLCRDPHGNIAWGTPAGRVFFACLLACYGAASVLRTFEAICDGRAFGQDFEGTTGSLPPYAQEAREAVVSSNLVEHTCRGLLLLLQLPQALDPKPLQNRRMLSKTVLSAISASWAFEPPLYGPQPKDPGYLGHAIWFPEPWHPELHGPSCQHLTLALGLHVLRCTGGPEEVYGLPGALEKALEEALGEALGEGASPGEGHGLWLRDPLRHLLALLAWHLETGCSRRGPPAAGGSGTAASGRPRAAGGTLNSLASASASAAFAASGGAAATSSAAPGAIAAAASAAPVAVAAGTGGAAAASTAAAAAASWPWRHAVRQRHVWDIAVRVVRMAVAAGKAVDGDDDGSGGGVQLQRSLGRLESVSRGDLGRLALCGLATLQLTIWRCGAKQVQGHRRAALRQSAPGEVGAEESDPGGSTAAPLVQGQGQEGSVRLEAQPPSSRHPEEAVSLGQEGVCGELGAGQEQERSSGRVQAEGEVVRQDVRLLAEWYGLALEVARYGVIVSGGSCELGLAAQLALQMPRMPEHPGMLPVRPPAKLRAALAGGYLPGLERLLRYVGQVPYSYTVIPISRYLCYAASEEGYGVAMDASGNPTAPHSDLPWLVWYGREPRHMASLLVTLGKLVTLADSKAPFAPTERKIYLHRPGGVTVVVPMRRALGGLRDCAVVACGDMLRVCSSSSMLDAAVAGIGGCAEVGAGGGSGGGSWMAGGTSGTGGAGSGGGSGSQRMHMSVFTITELLPRLAQVLNDALSWVATDGARRSSVPQPTTVGGSPPLVLLSACLVPFLRAASVAVHGWLRSCKAVCDAAGGEGTSAAAAAAADGSWRQLLLHDVQLPRVLAHVLQALPHLLADMRAEAAILAVGLCSVLVEAFPEEVRGSAVSPPRGTVGQEEGSGQVPSLWCPEKLLAAACMSKVMGRDDRTWRRGVETALRISAWASGVDVGGQQAEEAGPSDRWGALLARAGEALPVRRERGPLPSPAEAAAVVFPEPRCGFPGCINMEWDSEAGLRARGPRACGRCGAVRYCSRDCQAAHWRAGHTQECGREQQQQDSAGAGSGVAEGAPAAGQSVHGASCAAAAAVTAPAEEGEGGSSIRSSSSSSMGAFFALLEDVVGGRTDAALARLRGPDGKTLAGAADTAGLTALHWAAAVGGVAVISELLAMGADTEAKSEAGATAHKMATAHANMDVTCLLMEHDCKGKDFSLGDWVQLQRQLGGQGARLASGSADN